MDVVCPGFVSDCLETLEEIAIENKAAFLGAGGGEFHYIPCLNERDAWIRALADIALLNLQGWVDVSGTDTAQAEAEASARVGALWRLARLSSAGRKPVQRVFVRQTAGRLEIAFNSPHLRLG